MVRRSLLLVLLCILTFLPAAARATDVDDAIIAGDLAKVQSLIESDSSLLNPKIDSGAQPLYRAAEHKQVAIAEWLISKGADVNAETPGSTSTPLIVATTTRNTDMVKLLLDHGANVDVQEGFGGYCALSYSIVFTNKDIFDMLLAKGANTNLPDEEGLRPLHFAAGKSKDMVAELLDKGADVNAQTNDGDTPLQYAADLGDLEIVKLLLSKGANIGLKNKKGETVLETAAFHGKKEVAMFLIDQMTPQPTPKPAVTPTPKPAPRPAPKPAPKPGPKGHTPPKPAPKPPTPKPAVVSPAPQPTGPDISVFVAAALGMTDRVKECLKKDPSLLNQKNCEGATLLHLAVHARSQELIEYLLSAGMDVNTVDDIGSPAITSASSEGYADMVRLLRSSGKRTPR